MTDEELKDPIGPLKTSAIQVHELFEAYVIAGFTRPEALSLVQTILAISLGFQQGTGDT